MAAYDARETSQWTTHCWITIREQHEHDLKALLDTVTSDSEYFYIAIGEILLSGLTEDQILLLIDRGEDMFYRDDFDSVYVLEDLWHAAEHVAAQIAPNAAIRHRIAINLCFADPHMIDKLRTELAGHPSLDYVEIEFGED